MITLCFKSIDHSKKRGGILLPLFFFIWNLLQSLAEIDMNNLLFFELFLFAMRKRGWGFEYTLMGDLLKRMLRGIG